VKRDDAEEFTQALGQIAAGSYRQIALAMRLGVPQALGLSLPEWVNGRLGGYIKLSMGDRHKAVQELTAPEENGGLGLSKRQAAIVLGVDEITVRRDQPATNVAPSRVKPQASDDQPATNVAPSRSCKHCKVHCPEGR
jgi:hypothetical protein